MQYADRVAETRAAAIQLCKSDRRALGVRGVNLARVAATFLYDSTLRGCLRRVVLALFLQTKIVLQPSVAASPAQLLIFYSGRHRGREDHDYTVHRLRELAPGGTVAYAEADEVFSIRNAGAVIGRSRRFWGLARSLDGGIVDAISVALLLAKYDLLVASRDLVALLETRGKVLAFCDAHPVDNALVQLARSEGLESITIQHGQYRLLDESNMSPDAEAYLNFVSDKMLAWGDATVAEFERGGINADRLVVTGWIREWPTQLPGHREPTSTFGVMFNGENGKSSNLALLQAAEALASALDLRYVVRLHPMNDKAEYLAATSARCVSISQMNLPRYLDSARFSLAHMTGATIELLRCQSAVYLLDDGKLAAVFQRDGLSYPNVEQIQAAVVQDLHEPDECRGRLSELYRWYNDDTQQAKKVSELLHFDGE